MSKDLKYIRQKLKGFSEVDSPFDLKRGELIHYITLENDEEIFYSGKYLRMIQNKIIVQIDGLDKYVTLKLLNKEGDILYKTRIFNNEDDSDDTPTTEQIEFEEIIKSQQKIIEKMSEQNIKCKKIIENLDKKNLKYEGVIKKLISERKN